MFSIVRYRKWFFLFSGVIIVAGLIAMAVSINTYPEHSPVRLSIDFVSGSLWEIRYKLPVEGKANDLTSEGLIAALGRAGLGDVRVQRLTGAGAQLGTQSLCPTDQICWQARTNFVNSIAVIDKIDAELKILGQANGLEFQSQYFRENQASVSPAVGDEVTRAALIATLVASAVVLGWIVFAFRTVTNAFRYGVCAVLAMIHDILVMAGVMSIMGLVFGWEADALFLTGLLTVVGYSVQDTIVVFDRIRENAARHRGEPYEIVVNRSIMETVQRSLMTQLCVAFVLISLFLLGGGAIRQFVGILLIGLISGTYSSIFTAIPLLVAWENGELPFVNRGARRASASA